MPTDYFHLRPYRKRFEPETTAFCENVSGLIESVTTLAELQKKSQAVKELNGAAVCPECERRFMEIHNKMLWVREFGSDYDVPAEVLWLVSRFLLTDVSWHQNAMPTFECPGFRLWIDHPEEDKSSWGRIPGEDWHRFSVFKRQGLSGDGTCIYYGDDIKETLVCCGLGEKP